MKSYIEIADKFQFWNYHISEFGCDEEYHKGIYDALKWVLEKEKEDVVKRTDNI